MLNAIRLTLGTIMALLALGGLWFSFLFTGFKFWVYFVSLEGLFDFILIIGAPSIAAYFLLFPKTQKHALIGLGVSLLYLSFIFVDQIL